MSKEDLADFLGLARATVFPAIKEAEEMGLTSGRVNLSGGLIRGSVSDVA